MKNWINQTKTAVTTAVLFLALLGTGMEAANQNHEVYVKESIGLTQYMTPEPTETTETMETTGMEVDGENGWSQPEVTEESTEQGYTTEFKDEEIMYSSYYSYGEGCFSVEMVKEDLDVTTNGAIAASMSNSGIASSQQLLDACLSEEEKAELEAGTNKEIRVVMRQMVKEGLSDKQCEILDSAMEEYTKDYNEFEVGSYIQINISKKNEEGKWKKIKNFNNDIKLYIDIPEFAQKKEAKQYYLLQIRNGEYTITEDEDAYVETLTTSVSGSAMCGIGYTLPVAKAKPTVEPTAKPSYLHHLMNGDFCIWHWLNLSMLLISITWLLAIERKKIRIIFLSVMSILSVVMAIMGCCGYDWPIAVGCILVMVLVHIGKTYHKMNKKKK